MNFLRISQPNYHGETECLTQNNIKRIKFLCTIFTIPDTS